jgi:hypothetical protein
MANFNTNTQVKTGFFHALGYVLTKFTNQPSNELYKSAHNVQSSEIWVDGITFSAQFSDAQTEASQNDALTQVGDLVEKALLYPLEGSDRQSWFLDTGVPQFFESGFIPSDGWVRPLVSPVDVTNDAGAPSLGFRFKLYRPNGNEIDPLNGYWEVDYYAGILKFQEGFTPTDNNNGLGFQIDFNSFFNASDKKLFLETNGPRAIGFQYSGRYLSDLEIGQESTVGQGLTISNNEISILLSNDSGLTFSQNGELQISGDLQISGNSVYQANNPNNTTGDNQDSGIIISNTPANYSTVKVFVNGQALLLGTSINNVDCYFSSDGGNTAKSYDSIQENDTLYFNGQFVGWNLSTTDRVILIYETNV